MIEELIKNFKAKFLSFVERNMPQKNWAMKLTVICVLLSLFFAFPSYDLLVRGEQRYTAFLKQVENPFQYHYYPSIWHASHTTFRLTPAILCNLLGLRSVWEFLILQFIFYFFSFYLVARITKKITGDYLTSTLLTLSYAFILPGTILCSDYRGVFDVIAFFFLLLAMFSENNLVIFIAIILGSFTDERALVASTLVFLFRALKDNNKPKLKSVIANTKAVVLAWITYFLLKGYLTYFVGLKEHTFGGWGLGLSTFIDQFNNMPFGIWSGLEGFWLLVAFSLFVLYKQKSFLLASLYALFLATIILIALSVFDISRSMAFIVPAIFISLVILRRSESNSYLRDLSLVILAICFFSVTYYVDGEKFITWFLPLPLQILRILKTIFL